MLVTPHSHSPQQQLATSMPTIPARRTTAIITATILGLAAPLSAQSQPQSNDVNGATTAESATPITQIRTLTLPTENKYLETGQNDLFYTYVDRHFEGKSSRPWTGGTYGFVRNPKRTEDGLIYTRFHEGIDINPLQRDNKGEPTDPIKAVADGVVAYTNPKTAHSTYGKYTVLEHSWKSGPIYTLYAHLAETSAPPGEAVTQGQQIGILGHTGVGLDRKRAHLHLELSLLLSTRFQAWYDKHYTSHNYHGNHSGINLAGFDFAAFYLAQKKNPQYTAAEFIQATPVHYKVTTPRKGDLEIASRYPWLIKGDASTPTPSWELSLSSSGLPISIRPSMRATSKVIITYIRPSANHGDHTKNFISGKGNRAQLSKIGKRYIELVTGDF